jgi:serine/threonine protein kinase HipA of HipAB toxin-antitoxin module
MAPAGYLGRRFAERHPDLGLPASLRDWSDDHRLVALARRGEDAVGDVVLGEESLDRWLSTGHQEVTADDYPRLADEAAAGGAGSSAAGESPKLTAFVAGRHRLIKFTIGDGSPTDERWRDLLVCERLAAEVLRDAGHPSVEASVVDVGSRRFLDVVRFDRHGARGRIGTLSLGAIDDELVGSRESWTRTADALCALRLLSREDRDRLALLEAFSMLIGNDDRHAGNVTFFADGLEARPTLRLAPAYDVLPMALAPNPGGVPELRLSRPTPRARWIDAWPAAVDLARDFWARVAGDERVGAAFRETAAGWVGE